MSNNMSKEELKQAKQEAKALLRKPFYKKWWFWLLVIIVIIIIASSGGGDDTTPTDTTNNGTEQSTGGNNDKQEKNIAGIGEVIRVGDVEFVVNEVKTAANVGGEYGVNAQGKFLIVNTTVKNVGNESITTDSSFFKLLAGDKTYNADSTAAIYANEDTNFFFEQINPDLSLTGLVIFDVSDEVISNPDLIMEVQTGFFGTQTGQIKVGQ